MVCFFGVEVSDEVSEVDLLSFIIVVVVIFGERKRS